jgi:muramidase (phage lysozyme)
VAIKPAINPGVGVAERPASIAGAMNFISGGAPLGTSIVASAANKIVGFQRGAAAVAPRPPDLGSIIKTLSSNILNNVENRVQSINNNVQQFIQKNFQNQLGEYRQKLQSVDGDVPNRFLENFINLYKNAIGYIQFLGDRRNVKRLGDNLKALQEVFSETFQVARIIRQTIIRIVEQLSNLPKAAPGGSGIDVDVKVPGGPLKRAAPTRGSMLKMIGMAGAAGGAGMLGTKVVSGMMDVGDGGQVTPVQMETGGGLSGPMLERFNLILDKFDNAIKGLSSYTRSNKSSKKSSPTKSETRETNDQLGKTIPSGETAKGVTTTGEKGVLDLIASVEQGPEGYDSFNQSAGKTKGKATEKTIGWLAKNARGAIGRYQQMPQFLLERAKRAGFDENTKFTPEVQDAITLSELRKSHSLDKFLGGQITEEQFLQKLAPTWRGLPQGQINAAKLGGSADMTYQDLYAGRNAAGKTYARTISELKNIRGGGNKPIATTQPQKPSTVVPAPGQQQIQQQVAQQVSQPPATQSKPQVNVIPMNMSSPQTQSTPVGSQVPTPPILSKGGATVPFLTSTNHDNFLTLYSKMVYNIVDG